MGTDALIEFGAGAYNNEPTPRQTLQITPGNRQEDWEEFINMRLQHDGPYRFWKKRGGSTKQHSVEGNILTLFSFTATIDGSQKDYLAIHTDAGHGYLWEKDDVAAPTKIFDGIFNTTEQISFVANGTFLYLFDFSGETYKVYNLTNSSSSDWMSVQGAGITSYSWTPGGTFIAENNVWGFKENGKCGVFHKYYNGYYVDPDTNRRTYRSFIAELTENIGTFFKYTDPGGNQRETNDGFVGLFPDSPDLQDLVGKKSIYEFPEAAPVAIIEPVGTDSSDKDFSVIIDDITVPEEGVITALAADSLSDIAGKIRDALVANKRVTGRWKVSLSGSVVRVTALSAGADFIGRSASVEYHEDPGTLEIKTTDSFTDADISVNEDYVEPAIFRGYMMVDLLDDGSFTIPGKPIVVRSYLEDIEVNLRTGIDLTIAPPASNVDKRFLYATRWQTDSDKVFNPSTPVYNNSAWFFVSELDASATSFEDFTSDDELTQPLSADLPLAGGVFDFYGSGQLLPRSAASMEGSFVIGGYKVSRPVPQPYLNATNGNDGNIFVNQFSGTDLTGDFQIGFVFEYSDGKRSNVVLSGVNLNDSQEEVKPAKAGVAPDIFLDLKASADPVPPGTGSLEVRFDGNTVTTNWDSNLSGEDTLDEIAQKFRDDINADPDIGLTAIWVPLTATTGQLEIDSDNVGIEDEGKSVIGVFDNTDVIITQTDLVLTGAVEPEDAISRSGNQVQIHSLNTLVSSIYIVLKEGATSNYKLAKKVNIDQPQAHGTIIELPNNLTDVNNLDSFTLPSSNQIQETQDLFNWILPMVPFQQGQISEQTKIEDQSRIQRIVPTQFDQDKTRMRYRLAIFTDRNMQLGYIVFGGEGIESDFEIIGEGIELQHRFGAWYVAGDVIFQTRSGIHIFSGRGYPLIVDEREYDATANPLQRVVYNREWGEYWMVFSGTNKILAYDPQEQSLRTFDYPDSLGAVFSTTYLVDVMVLGAGPDFYYTDLTGENTDEGTEIEGQMITRHIGSQVTQVKVLEVNVGGQGYDCQVAIDQQKSRLENDVAVWTKDFTEDFASAVKALAQAPASYQLHKRGVMPKLKFKLTGTNAGFVSLIDIKYIETSNTGKARSS